LISCHLNHILRIIRLEVRDKGVQRCENERSIHIASIDDKAVGYLSDLKW
jgi:hypothetical protein